MSSLTVGAEAFGFSRGGRRGASRPPLLDEPIVLRDGFGGAVLPEVMLDSVDHDEAEILGLEAPAFEEATG